MSVVLAIGALAAPLCAQAPADEAQVKAAFVYNFLKFVEWPPESFTGPGDSLIIGIVGKGSTAMAAEVLLEGKHVSNRAIAVRRLGEDEPVSGVHAVFIGESDGTHVQRILDATASASILSIGEGKHFAHQGGVIGLRVESSKVRFEINTDAADSARLRISSKLLALARVITTRNAERDRR